jgi:hypothetical protein
MALTKACGFECGIVTAGLGVGAHWDAVGATPTITATARTGSRAMLCNATTEYVQRTCAATRTQLYFYGFFRVSDATPASDIRLHEFAQAAGSAARVVLPTTGVLTLSFGGLNAQTAMTCADNTWYGLEYEVDIANNPNVIRWRTWDSVNGWVNRTNVSTGQGASTHTQVRVGSPTQPGAIDVIWDDIVLGEGTVQGEHYAASRSASMYLTRELLVADVSPHPFTTNDFEYNDTTGIANTATDIWTYLDDSDQTSIADGFISQNVAWAAGTKAFHCRWQTDLANTDTPIAVAITSTHHSAGTGANEMNMRVTDDGTNWTNVWGDWAGVGNDVSDTSAHFRHAVLATKPSGGAWTLAALNGMQVQAGQSNDVSAIPYYDSISREVLWEVAAAVERVPYRSSYPQLLAH